MEREAASAKSHGVPLVNHPGERDIEPRHPHLGSRGSGFENLCSGAAIVQ